MAAHNTRAHSKFSASGSERWLNCAASVELEEGMENKTSPWAEEGTEAHEVLETLFKMRALKSFHSRQFADAVDGSDDPMIVNAMKMVDLVYELKETLVEPELLVEVRVYNEEIHSEMFGTVDAALVELFGTLHVLDYKYGQGHVVNPEKNTQMIQYALGLAEKFEWQFSDIVVHICQPRSGKNWHKEWKISIDELKAWREIWRKGVKRVEKGGNKPFIGNWCHWCKAKTICPAQVERRQDKIGNMFDNNPLTNEDEYGFKEESSIEEKGRKESGKKETRKIGKSPLIGAPYKKEKSVKKVDWEEI